MVSSIINSNDPATADVVFLSANYDQTSSFRKGADKGPAAIIQNLNRQIEFFSRSTGLVPTEHSRIAHFDPGDLNHLAPEAMVETLKDHCRRLWKRGKNLLILLGGEHSITNGFLKLAGEMGIAKEITIFQIDAHLDLRDTDADYSDEPYGKYAHSCVMRRAAEIGFPIVSVGIRAYSEEEMELARKAGVSIFELRSREMPDLKKVVQAVSTEQVYITLDVDGIDPSSMPATGTPVQGGLEWYYTLDLLREIFLKKEVVGCDIVEVAPRLDDSLTEYGAAQLAYEMIAYRLLKEQQYGK